jgi:hypothetical protein
VRVVAGASEPAGVAVVQSGFEVANQETVKEEVSGGRRNRFIH